ncbi:MAG: SurA N-terminal domain-containing protein [Aestuariivirga sp.]|uniref:peptidylprolyl isomerase n=1 Tax=Aestuariivirga sp. TaxID=2650926 RepID=UPI0025BF8914|nr:peptidylprolyl isomerase [Aestuariivirga sp.]MCA3562606.1 SurA N-terminal domain-containing protein [Aestuariivirga sp.]
MMDSMRKAAKGWVAKLLIGLLAVSFGVWGIADVFRFGSSGGLATVGSQKVTAEEYDKAFRDRLQDIARQTGQGITPEQARAFGIDKGVLTFLIQGAALDDEAAKLKLGVSDQFLATYMMANPAFLDSAGKFDAGRFKQALAQNGYSESTFFAEERKRMLRGALTGTAAAGAAPGGGLIEAQYRYENEQRDARYFTVTTADSEVAAPTADEIKKEYDADPAAYTAPEYRSIAIMKAEPADIAARITLTGQDLADGYAKHKAEYFSPEKRTVLQITFPSLAEAEAAKAKLAAGADFLALARERGFTEADATFAGKTKADFIDPAIADAAFALQEGTVSDPIKGTLSTALLKVVKIEPEHQATLDEVKPQLSERVKMDQAMEQIQSTYEAVEDARAAQTKFEDIAAKAGIPFILITGTDARGNDKAGKPIDIPHAAEVLQASFSSDVGVENDAIPLDNGYVWYEVREVVPAALKPFDQVKDQARAAVIAAKVKAASEDKARKLVERARSGASLDGLAKEANAQVQTAQGLKRGEAGAGFGPAAVRALFSVPDSGFAYAVEPDGKGARVMQSAPVLLPPFDPNSPDAKSIAERLKPEMADAMLTAYLNALQSQVGVSINEALWQQVAGQQTN